MAKLTVETTVTVVLSEDELMDIVKRHAIAERATTTIGYEPKDVVVSFDTSLSTELSATVTWKEVE